MLVRLFGVLILIVIVAITAFIRAADDEAMWVSIDAESHPIEGKRGFEKSFAAAKNTSEYALIFEQKLERNGSGRYWNVAINGTKLGRLEAHVPQQGAGTAYDGFHRIGLAVPPGVLKDSANVLVVSGQGQPAVVRNFVLARRSLKEALQLATVTVTVTDGDDDKRPVPARITVVDHRGQLAKLYAVRTATNAVRPGILYTLGSGDSFSLPIGKYTVYATRGMEWGVAKQPIEIDGDRPQTHALAISREVDTPGFVACDSHIHTLPGSGHGDASYAERMITIAGEGIEVAVATDHNHITDYGPHQHASGTVDHFHSIAGDEVTTRNGHFTAFPLDPANAVPGGVRGRNPLFLNVDDWKHSHRRHASKGCRGGDLKSSVLAHRSARAVRQVSFLTAGPPGDLLAPSFASTASKSRSPQTRPPIPSTRLTIGWRCSIAARG